MVLRFGERLPSHLPSARRRSRAEAAKRRLERTGRVLDPVQVEGKAVARSFWGRAWLERIESDEERLNRLMRGRSFVRYGSVLDLRIVRGAVLSVVSDTAVHRLRIEVPTLSEDRVEAIGQAIGGSIGTREGLLSGGIAPEARQALRSGEIELLPALDELRFECDCGDEEELCRHVAAALYGVAARLDRDPQALFLLRGVPVDAWVRGDADARYEYEDENEEAGRDVDSHDEEGEEDAGQAEAPPAPHAQRTVQPLERDKEYEMSEDSKKQEATTSGVQIPDYSHFDIITAKELVAAGIPRTTFQNWLAVDYMTHTGKRGEYHMKEAGWLRVERFFSGRRG